MNTVVLAYSLKGTRYSAELNFEGTPIHKLVDTTWVDVLTHFSKVLSEHPTAIGVIKRTDAPMLAPLVLSKEEADLFRNDPVSAIHMYTVTTPELKIQDIKHLTPKPIPAGYDTLICTFGDVTCIRYRIGKEVGEIEDVATGRWVKMNGVYSYPCRVDVNPSCFSIITIPFLWLDIDEGWAGVSTPVLLELPLSKFFLPRPWNTQGNWIKKSLLSEMFDTYQKEKKACIQELKA